MTKAKTRLKPLLSTVAVTALLSAATFTTPADAAEDNGFYARAGIGANWMSDADNEGEDASTLDIESDQETGFALSGAAGVRLNRNVRVEAEVSYRENDMDSLTVTDSGALAGLTADASGDVTSWGGMVNGYYDFDGVGPVPADSAFVPYLTGGIGLVNVDADVTSAGTQIVDDDDTVFAYQLGAGMGYALNERVTLDLNYRYFATQDPELTDASGADFESEYDNHTVMAGVRYSF